jgi:nucleoid-associated protein YgaU
VVKSGDTLSEIAARFLGSVRFVPSLLRANPGLGDRHRLQVGQRLVIPDTVGEEEAPRYREITVKKGDTLYGLAREHLGDGNEWPRLLVLNRDRVPTSEHLVPGTTLRVPAESSR